MAEPTVAIGKRVRYWDADDRAISMLVVDMLSQEPRSPVSLFLVEMNGEIRFIPCVPHVRDGETKRGRWEVLNEQISNEDTLSVTEEQSA